MTPIRKRLSADAYAQGILAGDRVILAQAITLAESNLQTDEQIAQAVLGKILHKTGNSIRIGVTGAPGVGKSTFIESFASLLTEQENKVAVLAVDPTSQLSKGSILGDKTRMEILARNPNAFIRPTAAGEKLGGVARKTRECIFLCEAAGFNVILVETVGVGQSEIQVNQMVDIFLLLMLAGAGDELQGIKKGIMEMANIVAITKADGHNLEDAKKAKGFYQSALHILSAHESRIARKVTICSSLEKKGLDQIWDMIREYKDQSESSGYFKFRRESQNLNWFHEIIKESVLQQFYNDQFVKKEIVRMEEEVRMGKKNSATAAEFLLELYNKNFTRQT
jgi:LAO/AO transport system kinase